MSDRHGRGDKGGKGWRGRDRDDGHHYRRDGWRGGKGRYDRDGKGGKGERFMKIPVLMSSRPEFKELKLPLPEKAEQIWVSSRRVGRVDDETELLQPRELQEGYKQHKSYDASPEDEFAVRTLAIDMENLGKPACREQLEAEVLAEVTKENVRAEKAVRILALLKTPTGGSFCTTRCLNRALLLCTAEGAAAAAVRLFTDHNGKALADAKSCKLLASLSADTKCPDVAACLVEAAYVDLAEAPTSSDPSDPDNAALAAKALPAGALGQVEQLMECVLERSFTAYTMPAPDERTGRTVPRGLLVAHPNGLLETELPAPRQAKLLAAVLFFWRRLRKEGKPTARLSAQQRVNCIESLAHLGLDEEMERFVVGDCDNDAELAGSLSDAALRQMLTAAIKLRSFRLLEKVLTLLPKRPPRPYAKLPTKRLLEAYALITDGISLEKHFAQVQKQGYNPNSPAQARVFNPSTHAPLFFALEEEISQRKAGSQAVTVAALALEALVAYYGRTASPRIEGLPDVRSAKELFEAWQEILGAAGIAAHRDLSKRRQAQGALHALLLCSAGRVSVARGDAAKVKDACADVLSCLRQLNELECFDATESLKAVVQFVNSGALAPSRRDAAASWPVGALVERFTSHSIDEWAMKTLCSAQAMGSDVQAAALRWHHFMSDVMSQATEDGEKAGSESQEPEDAEDALLALLEDEDKEEEAPKEAAGFFSNGIAAHITDGGAVQHLALFDSSALAEIFAPPPVSPPGAQVKGVLHQRLLKVLRNDTLKCAVPFAALSAATKDPASRQAAAAFLRGFAKAQVPKVLPLPLSVGYAAACAPHRPKARHRGKRKREEIDAEAPPNTQTEAAQMIVLGQKLQALDPLGPRKVVIVSSDKAIVASAIREKIAAVHTRQFLYGKDVAQR